ncbi:putative ABC exporter domain-containing protein [Anaerocolumna xylanovorans]|uniref:Putative ABC exporter n=1 Tax=Anaerocolumna xylanovorans DSM 12503 TaxID=1121345 RepID=A0A1M7YM53_9FIRM|nr:putative ABC exporter domain-containing protein [Anaerocolumna xylanovorans]SHO53733.1 Putative ABC exporter [Anaerocolumna xylanovorans DSM 12503]
MNSILYLTSRIIKNKFIRLLHKPAHLVLYLFAFGVLAYSLLISLEMPAIQASYGKIQWLCIFFAFYLVIFYFNAVSKGLSSGSSFFDMSDVNLLFCAPVNPKHILVYGICSQAGKSLLGGIFLLLQANTFISMGLTTLDLFLFFGGYVLALLLFEFMSLSIYIISNQKGNRKNIIKAIAFAPFLLLGLFFLYNFQGSGNFNIALLSCVEKGALKLIPVAGWITEGLRNYLSGNMQGMGYNLILTLLMGIFFLAVIILYHSDYYEDVLVATETAFEKKRAISEGNINAMANTSKKIRKGKRELKGMGPKALFYKHLLESSRGNRFFLFDGSSFLMIAGANIAAYLGKSSVGPILVLSISMYLQSFFIGTGRGLKELYTHYIYLIPESSFKKIIWSNAEVIVKHTLESIFMFFLPLLFTNWNPMTAILCALVRSLFSVFLVSANLLSQRIFKDVISQGLLVIIYLLFIIFAMAPGIIAAFYYGLFALSLWEALLSLLFFYLSRGVLHNSDIPTLQKKN